MKRMTSDILNALTIDVEDYFQVSAFAGAIGRNEWDSRECRVERNLDLILAALAEHQARATFFILGWIAERYPQVVRRIAATGHEVASHGFGHERASAQTEAAFFSDIRLAKIILEDTCGHAVNGYRAPSFSIGPQTPWAYACIDRAGYRYTSSIYPIRHDHYGCPDAPRLRHEVAPDLIEVPISTVRLLGRNWPAGGGGYFRLMPYALSRWAIERVNARDRQPAIFYFHPWEVDPAQPRVENVGVKTRFRHYVNLSRTLGRLQRLLRDFRWGRMDEIFLAGRATHSVPLAPELALDPALARP